jgi:hypothetical protein
MAQMSEVINTGDREIKEEFNGEIITIPAKGSVKMTRRMAVGFKGQFRPFKTEGEQDLIEAGYKPLKVVNLGEADGTKYISPKTGEEFATDVEYIKHLEQFTPLKDEETTTKVYVCPHCDKEVGTKAGLKAHMRSHDTKPSLL